MPRLHKSITAERLANLIESGEYYGICIYCGEEATEVEPDAQKYKCENCGEHAVYGAEELLFHIAE